MWHLDKQTASLRSSSFAFEFDIQSPEAGLSRFGLGGEPWPRANPYQIHSFDPDQTGQAKCDHVYQRGTDLVASYHMSRMPEFRWQVYWRALTLHLEDQELQGIELILSVQTDLLDCDPRLRVESHVPSDQLLQVAGCGCSSGKSACVDLSATSEPTILDAPGLLVYRPPDNACSYLEMIHPADFTNVKVSRESSGTPNFVTQYHLFEAPLEKGVIWRARLRSVISPRIGDTAAAWKCYRRFEESAIPLTA
jgi:hypothetical protein